MTTTNSPLDIWISGAVAVLTVDFLVYPFDTLKTRIQSPSYNTVYKDPATNTIRKNVLFRGLYQGVFSVVLSTIPASGAFFTTYETTKSALNDLKFSSSLPILNSAPAPLINALASSAGEMVSCLLLTPAEVIKQNAQIINNNTSNESTSLEAQRNRTRSVTVQVLRRFKAHPFRLFSGYTALVGRNLPFTGINFPIFEGVKGYLIRRRHEERLFDDDGDETKAKGWGKGAKGKGSRSEAVYERALLTGIAASISGSIASVITTPIDVVKTRMMLSASGSEASPSDARVQAQKSRGVWSVGREVFRDEGVKGLFRGGAIRVVWSAVAMSIYLSIYEGGRFWFEKRREGKREQGEDRGAVL
ncbi:mitochondrial carrier [Aspergillus karnatakaensis]|uniref:putative mitochondrial carrier protein n=1 Tax=Aspergillus karnatakaensis TaxID=1810916 RepID=UPI003CCE50AA